MASAKRVPIRVSANAPIFDLPILVALDQGLFLNAGLDVSYVTHGHSGPAAPPDLVTAQRFEALEADVYNLDAWSGVERMGREGRTARITALRPAIVAQAILSFDDTLYNPHDLGGVEIGVALKRASHYATVQLVSASLDCAEIAIRHVGGPDERLAALESGRIRAATLMEPHLSLALKQGAHLVAMTFYRGADVMASELTDDEVDAYYDAINDAVNIINAEFDRYRHLVTAPVAARLAPDELGQQFVRYTHAETYEEATARRVFPWMQAWESTLDRARH